jgi:hypothetical protein
VQHPFRGPKFLIWVLGARGRGERFYFHELLMCSQHVPKLFPKFSMCFPRLFPIAPNFKPICFAQNPPLLTYIHGVFVAMNPFEERNFIQPMGNAISSRGALVFFLLSFGCTIGRLEVGREGFFFKLYLAWKMDSPMSTWTLNTGLSMQVLLQAPGGGHDLFSFQPIGRPNVPYF